MEFSHTFLGEEYDLSTLEKDLKDLLEFNRFLPSDSAIPLQEKWKYVRKKICVRMFVDVSVVIETVLKDKIRTNLVLRI